MLFGIDKVTKYDMDAPLYVTTFAFVMNKDKYNQMSDKQKKAIDDNCNTETAGKVGEFWGKMEDAGIDKIKAESGHEVYKLTPEQIGAVEESLRAADQDLGRGRQEERRRSRRCDGRTARRVEEVQRAGGVSLQLATSGGGGSSAAAPTATLLAVHGAAMNRAWMDRFIDTIEWIAAGFVGIVAPTSSWR